MRRRIPIGGGPPTVGLPHPLRDAGREGVAVSGSPLQGRVLCGFGDPDLPPGPREEGRTVDEMISGLVRYLLSGRGLFLESTISPRPDRRSSNRASPPSDRRSSNRASPPSDRRSSPFGSALIESRLSTFGSALIESRLSTFGSALIESRLSTFGSALIESRLTFPGGAFFESKNV